MWTTPVARTATAPRYSAALVMTDLVRVTFMRFLSGSKARDGSPQRGDVPAPELDWGRGDNHRGLSPARHETCDLAVGGLRGRVAVDDARAAAPAELQVPGGGDDALGSVALFEVVPRAEAAPVRERLPPLLRGRVDVSIDPATAAEKG